MKRTDLLEAESACARRSWAEKPIELRAAPDGEALRFQGYASTTEHAYPVFGGAPYGWNETIARGAFKKTLAEGADVVFLVNHEGAALARTKSGTLTLFEDKVGLRAIADLDQRSNAVNDLKIAVDRGDISEMSFGFRVTRDEWTDEEGNKSNPTVGSHRRITEVNLMRGDVSAVNYGANENTSGGFRSLDVALSELRAGRPLSDEQRDLIRNFASSLDEAQPVPPETPKVLAARAALWDARRCA